MRISIKKHNQAYLQRLIWQMECNDPTEVINYLLMELKRIGYSFNAEVSLGIGGNSPLSHTDSIEPTEPGQQAMSGLSAVMDSDPVIDRLLSLGLEQF